MDANKPQSDDRCFYLGRCSSPKQKLEHQREEVLRYCEREELHCPQEHWFEDKVKRHHQIDKGKNFQRLMELCKEGKVDWILIATFDRWGITNKDEIFVVRQQLRQLGVRLWVVSDELEITGNDDSSFWRVAARAEGATAYVGQMAVKNIQKMVSMALQGLSGSGNCPYGTDLACYPLIGSSPDLANPLFRVVREKYVRPALYKIIATDGNETLSDKMPLRDKKGTAYRFEKSLDPRKLECVRLIFELYDSGLGFGEVAEHLYKLGFTHYDEKPFRESVLTKLLANPIYIGLPAWGKVGTGTYYRSDGQSAIKVQKKAGDFRYSKKANSETVQPASCIWPDGPIVDIDLFNRVQSRLEHRPKEDPAIGQARQRRKVHHPLNGKIICPECGEVMVLNACKSKGVDTVTRYFICGKYRRTRRKQCHANSFRFSRIDAAIEQLLSTVKDRIEVLTDDKLPAKFNQQKWILNTELGKVLMQVFSDAFGIELKPDSNLSAENQTAFIPSLLSNSKLWSKVFSVYNSQFDSQSQQAKDELAACEKELDNITSAILAGIPSETVRGKLNKRMSELESKKAELSSKLVPLTAKAESLIEQLHAIKMVIEAHQDLEISRLLDRFIEKVIPHFEGLYKIGCERPITFVFQPRQGNSILTEPMALSSNRMDNRLNHHGEIPWFQDFLASLFAI